MPQDSVGAVNSVGAVDTLIRDSRRGSAGLVEPRYTTVKGSNISRCHIDDRSVSTPDTGATQSQYRGAHGIVCVPLNTSPCFPHVWPCSGLHPMFVTFIVE